MNRHRFQCAVLLLGIVGLLLMGVCELWLWSYRRQEALNRQLIAALVNGHRGQQETPDDYKEALSLVNAGADPNTPWKLLPAPSLRQLWNSLVHHSPLPINDSPTAFLIACGVYWTDNDGYIYGGSLLDRAPLVADMLQHGANVEVKYKDGWTPLTFVAFQRDRETLDVLLAHGVNVNAKGYSDCSPLYWAMHSAMDELPSEDKETANIVLALLAHGADPNLPDGGGTLLQQAVTRPDLVALLKRAGAKK